MYSKSEIYQKTIDWDKRLRSELPFLEELLHTIIKKRCNDSNDTTINILDLGCGPGKHLIYLAKKFSNCQFYGIDLNNNTINYAQSTLTSEITNLTFQSLDFYSDKFESFKNFDLVFSLGNSLSLILGTHEISFVFNRLCNSIRPNGSLFFQILNGDSPRNGYVVSKIVTYDDGSEGFTLKRFEPNSSQDQMNVEFLSFHKENSQSIYTIEKQTSSWKLLKHKNLIEILQTLGFRVQNSWKNYKKEEFNSSNSNSLLCLARRE